MSTKNNAFPDCLKIPLIIGISGHIDILTPESEIAKRMTEFWNRLRELAGPNTPLILLSSIATGADHLAVKYRPSDVKYCAVLPFAEEEYRKDFSGAALADYENDLKNAEKVIICNAAPGDYSVASDYVRKHSDVLLTMWDGYQSLVLHTSAPKKGGTYYQILAAFHLNMPPLEFKEKVHLVVNLSIKRAREDAALHREHGEKNVGGFSDECELSVLSWDKAGAKFVAKSFSETCRLLSSREETRKVSEIYEETTNVIPVFPVILNRIREHNDHLPSEQRKDYYLRNDFNREMDRERSGGECTTERNFNLIEDDFLRMEYFDGQAEKHQRPFRKQFFWIAVWSVIVGFLGQAWGDIVISAEDKWNEWFVHIMIVVYLFAFVGLFSYYKKTKKDSNYFKYVRPRLIAEMLRLKLFWKLAGVRESFSDCFLKECAGYWFMLPICNWEFRETPLSEEDVSWLNSGNGFASVRKFWLEDQEKYYEAYLLKNPKRFVVPEDGEKCTRISLLHPWAWLKAYSIKYERCEAYFRLFKRVFIWGAFVLSIILVIVFIVFLEDFLKEPSPSCHRKHMQYMLLFTYREFIVGVCPFIVATLGWILEKHPWGQIALQYRKALNLFRKTERYLEEDHSDPDKRQMIRELIMYAHHENAEWNDIRNGAKPEPMI